MLQKTVILGMMSLRTQALMRRTNKLGSMVASTAGKQLEGGFTADGAQECGNSGLLSSFITRYPWRG